MKLKLLVICLFIMNLLGNIMSIKKHKTNTGIKSFDKILFNRVVRTGLKDPDVKRDMLEKIKANG